MNPLEEFILACEVEALYDALRALPHPVPVCWHWLRMERADGGWAGGLVVMGEN